MAEATNNSVRQTESHTLTLTLSRFAAEGTRLCRLLDAAPTPTEWERVKVRVCGSVSAYY
jgi:hypothetical protein